MRYLCILVISWSILNACSTNGTNSSSSDTLSSLDGKTVVTTFGNLDVVQDGFLFATFKKQGFFIYPQNDIPLFRNHFIVRLIAEDTVRCGMIQTKSGKKYLRMYASLTSDYKGDISGIADICAGNNATIYLSNGHSTDWTFNPKKVLDVLKMTDSKIVFPYIPYFLPAKLSDIASPNNDPIQVYIDISFFDRLSKKTMTNCTTYIVDNVQNTACLGTPLLYPENDFYGKRYQSQNMHTYRSRMEYLQNVSSQ